MPAPAATPCRAARRSSTASSIPASPACGAATTCRPRCATMSTRCAPSTTAPSCASTRARPSWRRLMRPQDQLRLFELHATDHGQLAGRMRGDAACRGQAGRRLHGAEAQLPPPTRRGLLLIDPPYEIKTDYIRVLAALREALTRFAECTVMIWLPQLQLLEAAKLPQRLKAAATAGAQGLAAGAAERAAPARARLRHARQPGVRGQPAAHAGAGAAPGAALAGHAGRGRARRGWACERPARPPSGLIRECCA
jgi:hypothetical protein